MKCDGCKKNEAHLVLHIQRVPQKRRNLVNILVVEPRYADPLSLVHYKKVLVTKAAMDQLKEMFA